MCRLSDLAFGTTYALISSEEGTRRDFEPEMSGFYHIVVLIVIFGLCTCQNATNSTSRPAKFLLMLFDGFRWNYLDEDLPNFERFQKLGVRAEYMDPTFPSLSYPGYYSIVTGLFPESHGFIENTMYDPKHKMLFYSDSTINGSQPFWWNATEPIWTTSTKAGKRTYVYLWPGCHVSINDTLPTYFEKYESINGTSRLQKNLADVLERFSKNETDVGIIYCEYTDMIGHRYGPESATMKMALKEVDVVIGQLLNGLETGKLIDKVNIIIVSDHGMTKSDANSTTRIRVTDVIDLNDVDLLLGYGAGVGVHPVEGKLDKVYSDLQKLKGAFVWKKEEIPQNLHFKSNDRVPPIQVVAKEGTFILPILQTTKQVPPFIDKTPIDYLGFHGYIPTSMPDMRSIFLAMGPDFKANFQHGPINMTDVYNLMLHVQQVDGHPNNGSWDNVKGVLKNGHSALFPGYFPLIGLILWFIKHLHF